MDLPGDDPRGPARHHMHLIAQLAAEPQVLNNWRRNTQNPRLADAYQALLERIGQRVAATADAAVATGITRAALAAETMRIIEEAQRTTFEPSRVKWLLARRRERLQAQRLPGHDAHRDDEAQEADELERILHGLLETMC